MRFWALFGIFALLMEGCAPAATGPTTATAKVDGPEMALVNVPALLALAVEPGDALLLYAAPLAAITVKGKPARMVTITGGEDDFACALWRFGEDPRIRDASADANAAPSAEPRRCTAHDHARFARAREAEDRAALRHVGLVRAEWLGYPRGTIPTLLEKPEASVAWPGARAVDDQGQPLTGLSLRQRIGSILARLPTGYGLLLPHPEDADPDARALYALAREMAAADGRPHRVFSAVKVAPGGLCAHPFPSPPNCELPPPAALQADPGWVERNRIARRSALPAAQPPGLTQGRPVRFAWGEAPGAVRPGQKEGLTVEELRRRAFDELRLSRGVFDERHQRLPEHLVGAADFRGALWGFDRPDQWFYIMD